MLRNKTPSVFKKLRPLLCGTLGYNQSFTVYERKWSKPRARLQAHVIISTSHITEEVANPNVTHLLPLPCIEAPWRTLLGI